MGGGLVTEDGEYTLQTPLVLPNEERTFSNGWNLAKIEAVLHACANLPGMGQWKATPPPMAVRTGLLPQLDLSAMMQGFVITHEPTSDEWSWVSFAPTGGPHDAPDECGADD